MGNCIAVVEPDELRVKEVFGEFTDIIPPGFSFLGLDYGGMCINTKSISSRIIQNDITCDTKTKDHVTVSISVCVQRKVITSKVFEAIYKLDDPSAQIESYVVDVIRSKVTSLTLDEVFIEKQRVAEEVRDRLTQELEDFGFEIIATLITEIQPHKDVQDAMSMINKEKRLRIAAESKAEAEKELRIKAAEAEAEAKHFQGLGIANQRQAIVDGLLKTISATKHGESEVTSARISELFLITQYFDMLSKVSAGKSKTIFTDETDKSHLNANLIAIDRD